LLVRAIEGAIAEERPDERATGGADLGGTLPAPGRRLQEVVIRVPEDLAQS